MRALQQLTASAAEGTIDTMRYSLPILVLVAAGGCGPDPTNLSQPDLRMRDLAVMRANECANGLTDGEETDQDCGGATCGPCSDGRSSKMGRDCLSTLCTNNICDAASCMDGVKN